MTRPCYLAVAAVVAAGLATAGAAAAAPAHLANVAPPTVESESAAPVYHWRQRCWPEYRWVWTHWGWRYRYVGTRCAPRYHHY
jgi:hypothetical protein